MPQCPEHLALRVGPHHGACIESYGENERYYHERKPVALHHSTPELCSPARNINRRVGRIAMAKGRSAEAALHQRERHCSPLRACHHHSGRASLPPLSFHAPHWLRGHVPGFPGFLGHDFPPASGLCHRFRSRTLPQPGAAGNRRGLWLGPGRVLGLPRGLRRAQRGGKDELFRSNRRTARNTARPAIFVLAFIPNPVFDLAGIAAGAAGHEVVEVHRGHRRRQDAALHLLWPISEYGPSGWF